MTLTEADLLDDPIALFRRWFDEAVAAELPEVNAMTLATADRDGRPSARTVLLKGVDGRGFEFFTNYESRKARELDANPHAALVFLWAPLHRQVRVTGDVTRLTAAESDAYFATRPRGSQLGAWASAQSSVLEGRAALEARLDEVRARFGSGEIPRPPHWGGYRLVAESVELWQGRPGRLHDRLRYTPVGEHRFVIQRLAP